MPLLEVSDLTVRFGGILALDRISFQVGYGETLAIIGPNGCGKTTLLNALSGFVGASGSIRIEGQEIVSKPAWWRARRCFGRTMQVPRCFESLALEDNLELARWATKLKPSTNPLTRASQVILSCFEPLLIPAQNPSTFIGLEKAVEVQLRRVFENSGNKLIMLDEPFAGQGKACRDWVLSRIRGTRSVGPGLSPAVLVIEHHLDMILPVVDRVLSLSRGQISFWGTKEEYNDQRIA
jgi:branched-chain amino acid transport system ATP-binding protein